jgi:hypothetical protein
MAEFITSDKKESFIVPFNKNSASLYSMFKSHFNVGSLYGFIKRGFEESY